MTYQMRPPHLVHRLCIVQLNVQILIYTLQCAADLDFVLEFDGDFVLDEGLEETVTCLSAVELLVTCALHIGYARVLRDPRRGMVREPEEEHCDVCVFATSL